MSPLAKFQPLLARMAWLALAFTFLQPLPALADPTGTLVEFDFGTRGKIDVDLFDQNAPQSVGNFLSYVSQQAYDTSLIHRVYTPAANGVGVVQGGAFSWDGTQPQPITTAAPIPLEYSRANTAGTLTAWRDTADTAASATSVWSFNTADNTTALGPGGQTADGYAVFGWIVGSNLSVLNGISQVPTWDYSPVFSTLDAIPLQNFTEDDYENSGPGLSNLLILNSVKSLGTHPAFQNPLLHEDVDNNGTMTAADLSLVLEDLQINGIHKLTTAFAGSSYLDVDGNGVEQAKDELLLLEAFAIQGKLAPQGSPSALAFLAPPAAVPEPSTFVLALLAALGLGAGLWRRRRSAG